MTGEENGIQQFIVYVSFFAGGIDFILCRPGKIQKHYFIFVQFVFLRVGGAEICAADAVFHHSGLSDRQTDPEL